MIALIGLVPLIWYIQTGNEYALLCWFFVNLLILSVFV